MRASCVAGVGIIGLFLFAAPSPGGAHATVKQYQRTRPSAKYQVLFTFHRSDGAAPISPLIDVNGTLYGTTLNGGASSNCTLGLGCGTVFALTPSGGESVLYSFNGTPGMGCTLQRALPL